MLNDKPQLERLRAIVAPVCEAHGLVPVDARFTNERGLVLQVLIERPNQPAGHSGVSLADCQAVSRDLLTVLDVEATADELMPPASYRLQGGFAGVRRAPVS